MTKEDWDKVKETLERLYCSVELKIDGYKITLRLERVSPYKNVIAIYIDGKMNGKWLMEDCEERRRFLWKREKSVISNKVKNDIKKLPKKQQKYLLSEYDKKYAYYYPYFISFSTLKKQLISNNQNIELIQTT